MSEIPQWLLDNHRWESPTEIFVPIVKGIGPVWQHAGPGRGGWYGYIAVGARMDDDRYDGQLLDCDHVHDDEESAWSCADLLAERLTETVLDAQR